MASNRRRGRSWTSWLVALPTSCSFLQCEWRRLNLQVMLWHHVENMWSPSCLRVFVSPPTSVRNIFWWVVSAPLAQDWRVQSVKPLVKMHQVANHNGLSSLVFIQAQTSLWQKASQKVPENLNQRLHHANTDGPVPLSQLQHYWTCALTPWNHPFNSIALWNKKALLETRTVSLVLNQ